jgi:3-phenylpropionate/trans-cinnamate dioxygenase ferredoxin component
MTLERVCSVQDVPDGEVRRFDFGSVRIALAHIGGTFYAIGDRCTHLDVSLSEGEVHAKSCELECPKHGSCFSLETGIPNSLPATKAVPTYVVRIDDADVYVEID